MRWLSRVLLLLLLIGVGTIPASAQSSTPETTEPAPSFPFTSQILSGTDGLQAPTSLQFGPDGRLYVSQRDGTIRIYTVSRQGRGAYQVSHSEAIDLIHDIPNHDDNGDPQPNKQRQVTGLLVTGSADHPVIYVTSSDYRVELNVDLHVDLNDGVDTNSGVLSRLTWDGTAWQKLDLVRGLPRSPLDHSTNGLALDSKTNTLYIAQGGNSNMGAPLKDNDIVPEYAYSAAILTVDLNAIGNTTYDMPTLDDPDRPGNPDANDPFGGDGGLNQAMIVPNSPVQIYATGFRNSYDLLLTDSGRLYTITNGANSGWGGTPTDCTNATSDTVLPSDSSSLHLVTKGYYAGHPNPTRGSKANQFGGQSPILQADPQECDYIPPAQTHALALFDGSVNGLTQYTASNFSGTLKGDLLAADYYGPLHRIALNSSGDQVTANDVLFNNFGAYPLDVTAQGDDGQFPGTIWVAVLGDNKIQVFEPLDYGGATIEKISAPYSYTIDSDGDGYSNADEYDNGTDPLNPASYPPDYDHDHVSNLNDHDDDNDGIDDVNDPFALDPSNGADTKLPINYTWDGGNPDTGLLGLGFTGVMINHKDDYGALFDPNNIIAGGANGWLTIKNVTPGDPFQNSNDQRDAFQFGVPNQGAFTVRTRILAPFFNAQTPVPYQSEGVYVGTGDQDNYAKLILNAQGFQVVYEEAGQSTELNYPGDTVAILKNAWIDLYLYVDGQGAITPSYRASDGTEVVYPAIRPNWLASAQTVAVGILATSKNAPTFTAIWDFLTVLAGQDSSFDSTTATMATPVTPITATPQPPAAPTAAPNAALAAPTAQATETASAATTCDFRSATSIPLARAYGNGVLFAGHLYLFGGFTNAALDATNHLDIYDPVSDQWTRGANLPFPLTHQGVAVDETTGTIWMAGGFIGNEPGTATDQVWKYDVASNQWDAGPALPMPAGGGQLVLLGRTLHYFGGVGSDRETNLANHWTLDMDDPTAVWKGGLAGLLQPRIHFGAVVLNGAIYAIGGEIHHDINPIEIASVERYDADKDTWTRVADMPYTRSHMEPGTFVYDGKIYVIGGQSTQINVGGLSDVLVYDPATDHWQEAGYLPDPRFGTFARIVNGEYVIIGGGIDWSKPIATVELGQIGQNCATPTEGAPAPNPTSVPTTVPAAASGQVALNPLPVCLFRSGAPIPVPHFETQSLLVGQKVYLLGGLTNGLIGLNRLDIYDVASDQWSQGADLPQAISHQAVAYDPQANKIWMAGGFLGNDPGTPTDQVWTYDLGANRWDAAPSLPMTAASGQLVLIGRKLHFLGGFGSDGETNLANHWTLNLDDPSATWKAELTPMLIPRGHFSTAVLNGMVYAIGGQLRHEDNEIEYTSAERYDPAKDTWTRIADMPFPRSHTEASTFVYNGKIYVVGGRSLPIQGLSDVLIYDPASDTWANGGSLPAPRTGFYMGVVNGQVVIIGGGTSYLSPSTEVWLGQVGQACASLNDTVALPSIDVQQAHAPEALVEIVPPPNTNISTYDPGSFRIINLSTGGQQIVSAQFDISNSLLPNTLFDPDGTKGDKLGKPFTVDQANGLQVTSSMTTDHALALQFASFDPGKTLEFSMDIDPAELHGETDPGPDGSGAVDGFELINTQVTLTFSDGTQRTTWLYHLPGDDTGSANVTDIPTDAPTLRSVGGSTQSDQQIVQFPDLPQIQVSGKPGDTVQVLVAFGTYHTDATMGPAPDAFAFDSVDSFVEMPVTIPASGVIDLPIAFKNVGVYTVIAVVQGANGAFSQPSNRVTFAYTS